MSSSTRIGWFVLLLVPLPAAAAESGGDRAPAPWAYDVSLSWYFLHDGTNYGQPAATADQGPVHLETRYNYEALRTASFFVGWNLEFGDSVAVTVTPIAGCMAGDAGGPILGLELSVEWGPLSWSAQGEWVTDLVGGTGGYLYAWSELAVSPWEWLHLGVAVQRTRVFHTPREVIFGPLVGVTVSKLNFSATWFQPGGTAQTFVVTAAVSF